MKLLLVFLVVAIATAASHATNDYHVIRRVVPNSGLSHSGSAKTKCLSWRLAVETYNLRDWKLVPAECISYIGNYMMGKQHGQDCTAAADAAFAYAKTINLTGDGKDAWVLDIDQTALSLLDYYARPDVQFGGILYNDTRFEEWLAQGTAAATPAVLDLYNKLKSIGFKIVFISGTSETQRDIRIANLNKAGYYNWEKLLLKSESEHGTTAQVYKTNKRTKLVGEGYRIHGNMGDQWSDLIGPNNGDRTFKLPNPMFFIP
ncbi:acid phosphatase 1-like [Cynara cardunculus var. scolymus]|uniref:Acid phosphatase (Class B) n=1 Tax=Cynara cardunculus var. scolymus TaxID=59895 RepID=A0A124SGC1_CYNCS|nr:acid phosphatase 1-like [Cynara cardunculus var. scolymus]KVI05912.1 Acid phosphatase (Class B) [Cynara cardunculus var. scolymus]